jgi:lipopolysaccharide/colanic/teichoic acid biosynthesis glycosyltransferase
MEMRRLVEQRVPLALTVCAAIGAVAGAILVVPATSDRVLMAVAIVLFTVFAGAYERHKRLDGLLEFMPRPKARLTAQRLGAKPSAVARKKFGDAEAPYVWRDPYDDLLDAALRTSRFVVVKGVTNSGKTRAVFEAIGRVFPDRKIVLPNDPTEEADALGALLETRWLLRRWGRYVLVINDIENRLSALQGYAVRKWLKSHPRSLIVATLSAELWAELLAKEQTPQARAATKLLAIAEEVPFDGEFAGRALAEARRLYGLPPKQTRLGTFLASADRAIDAFEAKRGTKDRAARALALSGINCARAGLVRPVELGKLLEMARRVTELDGRTFSEEEWQAAADYCISARDGVVGAILESHGGGGEGDKLPVTANPALVERIDRGPGRDEAFPELPGHVWEAIVEIVADGPYDLLLIAAAATWRGRPDLAQRLFEEVARKGGEPGGIAASRLKEPDRVDEPRQVTELLERASVGPKPRQRGPAPRPAPEAPSSNGTVFDPTIHRGRRWDGFYGHQTVRDAVRFSVLLLFDVVAVCTGIWAAQKLGAVAFAGSHAFDSSSLTVALIAAGLVLTFFLLFGLYRADRERARLGEIIKSTLLAAVALSLWVIGKGFALINLPLAALAAAGASGLVYLLRRGYDGVSRAWVKRNGLQSRVLLIASERPTATAEMILNGCRRPMQMVGYLSDEPMAEPGRLGRPEALQRVAEERRVDRVIIAEPSLSPRQRLPLIYQCHALDLVTEVVPTSAELFQGATHALDDMAVPLVVVRPLYLNYVDKATKRALDLLIAVPLSILAFVLLLPLGVGLKLRSPGERVLTWDYRAGLGAVVFPMWRLRTERNGSVTRVGGILERTRINELPQFLNVLAGNMSLVGPRPLSSEAFAGLDVFQRARYAVLPGITGLWQVAGRTESSLDDMSSLDIVYCRKWTPLLDLTILLLTLPAVRTAPR